MFRRKYTPHFFVAEHHGLWNILVFILVGGGLKGHGHQLEYEVGC
jgi:hypothetical protein